MEHFFKDQKDKRYYKIVLSFFIPAVILLLSFFYFHFKRGKKLHLGYTFNGTVDHVSYDVKGNATIYIKGITYGLDDPSWEFYHNRIEKGDSMVKSKNSMTIKLFKKDGRVIVMEGD